jgi:hypothetical protein
MSIISVLAHAQHTHNSYHNITCPVILYSNPHLAGLASLHRGGGGGSSQVAEIHYKKNVFEVLAQFFVGTA